MIVESSAEPKPPHVELPNGFVLARLGEFFTVDFSKCCVNRTTIKQNSVPAHSADKDDKT